MPFNARVVEVMIASPGDVGAERQVIRELVLEWNAIYARERSLVVLPVGWETHASPRLGERAQEVINEQILHSCDLLVGVFWTRLGTPTGEAASGSVEEIEKHVAAGKPAMLYFSNAPVHPDSVDPAQYQALKDFRDKYMQQGLVEFYDSVSEFREKFARQFAQTIVRDFDEGDEPAELTGQVPPPPQLSSEAIRLLTEAARGHGHITILHTGMGPIIEAGDTTLLEQGATTREEAKWRAALEQLVNAGLIVDRSSKGEVFTVTDAGYRMADTLAVPGDAH
ncbi:MAG TPA: hypothetical protein VGC44_04830 [Longimicrobiales bacterium]